MKKYLLLFALILVAALSSCSKGRNCRCTTTDAVIEQTYIINTDRTMRCGRITMMGIEHQATDSLVRNMVNVSCEETDDAY